MPSIVVDTDVVSYLFKRDTRAGAYHKFLVGREPILSFMTLAELERCAVSRNWGVARYAQLERFLQDYNVYYAGRDLCRVWAEISHTSHRRGKPLDHADAWIAASALVLGLPLVTNNPDDYLGVERLVILSEQSP